MQVITNNFSFMYLEVNLKMLFAQNNTSWNIIPINMYSCICAYNHKLNVQKQTDIWRMFSIPLLLISYMIINVIVDLFLKLSYFEPAFQCNILRFHSSFFVV